MARTGDDEAVRLLRNAAFTNWWANRGLVPVEDEAAVVLLGTDAFQAGWSEAARRLELPGVLGLLLTMLAPAAPPGQAPQPAEELN